MDMSAVFSAIAPLFFVLILGYVAGRVHSFTEEQAAGLGKLALGFALPASLFVGMSALPRGVLAAQWKLASCLVVVHVGLLIMTHLFLNRFLHLPTARSLIFSLALVTSATPIFGIAILSPLLGATTIAVVGLVALAINLAFPVGITLLEIDAATERSIRPETPDRQLPRNRPITTGIRAGLRSPLLWAPILGGAVALSGERLPKLIINSFNFIGSATAGVAVFAVGIILSAQQLAISRSVVLLVAGRLCLQSLCLFVLAKLLHVGGPIYDKTPICCTFPMAATVNLLAARYRAAASEAASVLLISTVLIAVSTPVTLYLVR